MVGDPCPMHKHFTPFWVLWMPRTHVVIIITQVSNQVLDDRIPFDLHAYILAHPTHRDAAGGRGGTAGRGGTPVAPRNHAYVLYVYNKPASHKLST